MTPPRRQGRKPAASSRRVLVVGDIMLDIMVQPFEPFTRGSDTQAWIGEKQGGSGANQAAWLAYFGVDVTLAARVAAADVAAQAALLRGIGVTPALAADPLYRTGRLVALVERDGERSFFTDRAANMRLCRADLPDSLLDDIGLLHISGHAFFSRQTGPALRALMKTARQHGIPVSIDPASASMLRAFGAADFLARTSGAAFCFPNRDEAAVLSGSDDPDEQAVRRRRHFGTLVYKRGDEGAVVVAGGVRFQAPGRAVKPVDSTGAGDAFLGAYLARHLAGGDMQQCLWAGNSAGEQAVRQIGGRPPPRKIQPIAVANDNPPQ